MDTRFKTFGRVLAATLGVIVLFILIIGSGNYIHSLNFFIAGKVCMLLFPVAVFYYVRWLNFSVSFLEPVTYGFSFRNLSSNLFKGFVLATLIVAILLLSVNLFINSDFIFLPLKIDWSNSLAGLVTTLLISTIWEEFFFRGFVLTTFIYNKFGFHLSATLSSIIFALVHSLAFDVAETAWLWYLSIVILGYISALLYVLTKSIWSAAAFHFTWDFLLHLIDARKNNIGIFTIGNYGIQSESIATVMAVILALAFMTILIVKHDSIKNLYPAKKLYGFPDGYSK